LTRADEAARAAGDAISQVQVGCGDSRRRILIANSEGLLAEDDQVRTRFNVMCVANGDTGMQTGHESLARTEGYEIFARHNVEDLGRHRGRPGPGQALGPTRAFGRGADRAGRRQRRDSLS
jgi:TldD protein